jgi:hypothetical protein
VAVLGLPVGLGLGRGGGDQRDAGDDAVVELVGAGLDVAEHLQRQDTEDEHHERHRAERGEQLGAEHELHCEHSVVQTRRRMGTAG